MSPHSRLACALCALGIVVPTSAVAADSGGAGYTGTTAATTKASKQRTTRSGSRHVYKLGERIPMHKGMKGHDVKGLQKLLSRVVTRLSRDGSFGSATLSAERSFESRAHRPVDGVLDATDLAKLRKVYLQGGFPPPPAPAPLPPGSRAKVNKYGLASVGSDAPQVVKDIIAAGNRIASKPYVYGGGHGRWNDSGYDCSGSVSYALHGAGLLKVSRDSTGFESFGRSGYGHWVTIYANAGHAWMTVAGLRFDTSGLSSAGSRWQTAKRSHSGYVIRHPAGL